MELREIIKERDEAIKHYCKVKKAKLIELCEECGLYNVDVYAKGMKGRIYVEKTTLRNDCEIRFHQYTQSGVISKKATYIGILIWDGDSDEQIKEKLKKTFSFELC